jgi:hypothetical protein
MANKKAINILQKKKNSHFIHADKKKQQTNKQTNKLKK